MTQSSKDSNNTSKSTPPTPPQTTTKPPTSSSPKPNPSPSNPAPSDESYRLFYAERCPMWLVIKAAGALGHEAKLYDNTEMENLLTSVESVRRFRAAQFDLVKAGLKEEGEAGSVNMVFLKAGTPSPTVCLLSLLQTQR
ncbi:hypothetical protein L1987_65090 [Smallanthus sonchifolius]|uniref:Uncharacterized protein n=1 Tax=Smallanthus sonchifolius TaxID=185202 RepID=A0ACB9BTG4_9ASTR|nr:hypothetical protein L1987_65090 [Smallanthus sonchifolius]